jgi:hypothetical protein
VGPGVDLHETLSRVVSGVRVAAEKLGRDPAAIEMTVGGARTVAQAEQFAGIGIDRLVIAVRSKSVEDVRDELGTFGEEVIAQTRDL